MADLENHALSLLRELAIKCLRRNDFYRGMKDICK